MILYLVNMAYTFLAAVIAAAMVVALVQPVRAQGINARAFDPLAGWAFVAGLAAGGLLYWATAHLDATIEAKTALRALAVLSALVFFAVYVGLRRMRGRFLPLFWLAALSFVAVLGAQALFDFCMLARDQSMSVATVLNTELILNIGAVTIGALVIGLIAFFAAHMGRRVGRAGLVLFCVYASLLLLQWVGDLMLGLLRLDLMELTRARLSFVGKVTNFSYLFTYAQLILVALLAALFFRRRPIPAPDLGSPERRKAMRRVMVEVRWLKAGAMGLVFVTTSLLYYDLYASRPPTLSEAAEATPQADGFIRIRIDDVADGKLYRYAYISEDGHRVRFFLINRIEGRRKIGVVYDACMICGDEGYIQEGNQVICIACGVRIFIPSIGKPGGCNPIPIKHQTVDEHILIAAEELEKGARYFSEVVAIEVQDPVTGKRLINLDAPFQYEYKGKAFYFESEDSYEQFKATPEKYAGNLESRYFRAQGWQTSAAAIHGALAFHAQIGNPES